MKKIISLLIVLALLMSCLPLALAEGQQVQVTKGASVRDSASFGGAKLTMAAVGDTFEYVGKEGNWVQVRLADGSTGWLPGDSVKVTEGAADQGGASAGSASGDAGSAAGNAGSGAAEAATAESAAASTEGPISGAVSFTVKTSKDYGKDLVVFRNEIITVYLKQVNFYEEYANKKNIMTVNFACDLDPVYFPKITGYSANGDLTSLKVGGVKTKTAMHISDGLMGSLGEKSLQYAVENPEKLPVDLEITVKNSRFNSKRFNHKIGPIHIEIDGDLYDGAGEITKEATASHVSLGGIKRGEAATLVDESGVKIQATRIELFKYDESSRKLSLIMTVTNENDRDVLLTIPFDGIKLNGEEAYFHLIEYGDMSTIYHMDDLTVPAKTENLRISLDFDLYGVENLSADWLENGEMTLWAQMPTTDELAAADSWKWPDLFKIEPLTFDMAYVGEPEPETVEMVFPAADRLAESEPMTWEGLSFRFVMEPSGSPNDFRSMIVLYGLVQNDSDMNLAVRLESLTINGMTANFSMSVTNMSTGEQLGFCPAGEESMFTMMVAIDGMMQVEDVKEISCKLCYTDVDQQKNVVWQPIHFTVE